MIAFNVFCNSVFPPHRLFRKEIQNRMCVCACVCLCKCVHLSLNRVNVTTRNWIQTWSRSQTIQRNRSDFVLSYLICIPWISVYLLQVWLKLGSNPLITVAFLTPPSRQIRMQTLLLAFSTKPKTKHKGEKLVPTIQLSLSCDKIYRRYKR